MSSNIIEIEAKEDFLERLSSSSSLNALAELVWNGLDAGSDRIDVRLVANELSGLEEIRIQDYGSGIPHDEVQLLFGNLGASWKKAEGRKYGRALHGKDGQGRFKAFALGNSVTWNTIFPVKGGLHSYQIKGEATALDALTYTDPSPATKGRQGTQVIITDIQNSHGELMSDHLQHDFAKLFAVYLSKYPAVTITVNGDTINPVEFQSHRSDIALQPVLLKNGKSAEVDVSIVEWSIPTKRAIHLCDKSGVTLHELEARLHAPGFDFTAYIKSDHFRDLDKENVLMLGDLHPDVDAMVSRGRDAIRTHFRKRLAARQSRIVDKWKKELIYPYEEKTDLTPVESAERQVFDILGVNLEAYLPRFEEADQSSRRFTFRLLAQALSDNPKSVQRIITEVLNLKPEEQEDLARLLEETTLSCIISSAKIVANRMDFLIGLEDLLFDKDNKKQLLERDQLHKILETESWVFDEGFALSGSEKRLEEVLQLHICKLGQRSDQGSNEDGSVMCEGGKQGRVDLMLSRTTQPRSDEYDHLVVELKRPSKAIDSEVLTQVESYAIAVAKDPRFHTPKTRWRFIAVSNEMDDHARRKAKQRDKPSGLVFDDAELNVEVWAYDWTEIIANARSRLQFINASLNYEATRDTAKEYLLRAHEKFIPSSYAVVSDDNESEAQTDDAGQSAVELATAEAK